jgi:opacity protein-like surface antigen
LGKGRVFLLSLLLACGLAAVFVSDAVSLELTRSDFLEKDFIGGRLGLWTNTGDDEAAPGSDFSLDFSSSSVYGEFFYTYRVTRPLALELSLGLYSRGEVKYIRVNDTYIGSVNLYPILLGAKFYPLSGIAKTPFHINLQPGVGLVYGKQDVVSYIYADYAFLDEESRAKFVYFLGAGIDWAVSSQIGLTASFKYMPVEFGKALAEVKNYTGWTLAFGVGYIFGR